MRVGRGPGIGLSLSSSGVHFQPTNIAGCVLWVRADMGVTLGGTLLASGTAPPAVTISGSTSQSIGLRVEIQTTGARGAATFRWSPNNGTTWEESNIVTAATYALSNGITLNFPVGAYTNDNVYQATVSAWADQSGNGHDLTQGTGGAQPTFEAAGLGGKASILADGTNDTLKTAGFTLNQPSTVFCVGQAVALETNGSFFDGFTVNTMRFYDQGADQWAMYAGATGPKKVTRDTNAHVFACEFNGASSNLWVDGGTAHTGNPGAGNGGGLTLFVDGGGAAQYYNARIAEVVVYNRSLSAGEIQVASRALGARYGIAVA